MLTRGWDIRRETVGKEWVYKLKMESLLEIKKSNKRKITRIKNV